VEIGSQCRWKSKVRDILFESQDQDRSSKYNADEVRLLLLCHADANEIDRFRLRSTPSRALNVSLFNIIGEECRKEDLEQGKEVMTSGAFLDAPCGVTTGLKTLRAGTYWLIPSTYVVGTEASWEMIVHHSKRDVSVEGPF
jgi:hypothetical protein